MSDEPAPLFDHAGGTETPWYRGWDLTDERRAYFRDRTKRSQAAKQRASRGLSGPPLHEISEPAFLPESVMPERDSNGLAALSLFSGGGGLDLGFDRAGFGHVASFDTLEASGRTLHANRPHWQVFSGAAGDVRGRSWGPYKGVADILHGGFPCQPFSSAGRQQGDADERNMLPEFVRAIQAIRPAAFIGENVTALTGPKFAPYLDEALLRPLGRDYTISMFTLAAQDFGVPQVRRRVFFVGFLSRAVNARFVEPVPTHSAAHLEGPSERLDVFSLTPTMGVREALGLPVTGVDGLAPTLRSTLTGPRHTTSILSSASAQKKWARMGVWPNGVAASREAAQAFPAENGHFRLSVDDCAVLQGFPADWTFDGPVYMALGQVGNSVAPPVGYRVACTVADAIRG